MNTLSHQELDQIKGYVLRDLPDTLDDNPKFAALVEKIVRNKFPDRDELMRTLKEWTLTYLKEPSEPGGDGRHPPSPYATRRDVKALQAEMRSGFQNVDRRLTALEKEVRGIDRRLTAVEKDVQNINRRLTALEKSVQDIDRRLTILEKDVRNIRDEMREIRQEMSEIRQEMHDTRAWMELTTGRLQTRTGHLLENVVAAAFRLGLQRPDIQAEHIRLRQKIVDTDGQVFKAGKQKEVDIIAKDGELLVFEVKSAPDVDDVDYFADKVSLVRLQNPDKKVSGILVALGAEDDVRQACEERGLMLIPERRS